MPSSSSSSSSYSSSSRTGPSSSSSSHRNSSSSRSRREKEEWRPRSVNLYPKEGDSSSKLGEGTYGAVFKGIRTDSRGRKNYVALKRINKEGETEGFPITAIREISILKTLEHENIVNMSDVVSSHVYTTKMGEQIFTEKNVYMVFEFCDHDMKGLFDHHKAQREPMPMAQIKYYLQCILRGIDYCFQKHVIHRDIKGANILISNNGDVRIADFGLARKFRPTGKRGEKPQYTPNVVTLWYRAPELLLGVKQYDHKIDVWSVGCVFAEMLCENKVLFPGDRTEIDQLNKIWAICGTPTRETWPQCVDLLDNLEPAQALPNQLKEHMNRMHVTDELAIDLLGKLLDQNPETRIDAATALEHKWFSADPLPIKKSEHPTYQGNFHEYHTKTHEQHRERESQAKALTQRSHEQYKERRKRKATHMSSAGGYRQRGGGANVNFFQSAQQQQQRRKH